MGNCFGSKTAESSPASIHSSSCSFFTPGALTSNNKGSTAFSALSRISGYRQLSAAESEGGNANGKCLPTPNLEIYSSAESEDSNANGTILPTPNLKVYSLAELKVVTSNFKSDMVLGTGGFGTVFKGWVDENTLAPSKPGSGMIVAIKKLNRGSLQGFEEWQSEVKLLGMFSHPNLIKLLGYCWEYNDLLLVYEYMQNGSLENLLFRNNVDLEALSWDMRLSIAIGAARGLAFLHTSEKQVICRDFKSSNILLDENYNAKISDFGLAKLGPSGGNSHVTTRVLGTEGYIAPEYLETGYLYVKSDVYCFGIFLLEMLTGLRALDYKRPSGQHWLVDWVKPMLSQEGKLKSIMDVRMEGQYSSEAELQAAQLTLRCLESRPEKRPSMEQVLENLKEIEAMKEVSKSKTKHGQSAKKEKPKWIKNSRSGHSYSRGCTQQPCFMC